MNKHDNVQATSISNAQTLTELAEYWDTHSLTDHWDETHEVNFVVRAKRRHRVVIEPDLYDMVETQAKQSGIQPETLINLWISERVQAQVAIPH